MHHHISLFLSYATVRRASIKWYWVLFMIERMKTGRELKEKNPNASACREMYCEVLFSAMILSARNTDLIFKCGHHVEFPAFFFFCWNNSDTMVNRMWRNGMNLILVESYTRPTTILKVRISPHSNSEHSSVYTPCPRYLEF